MIAIRLSADCRLTMITRSAVPSSIHLLPISAISGGFIQIEAAMTRSTAENCPSGTTRKPSRRPGARVLERLVR